MAGYSTSAPPILLVAAFAKQGPSIWNYATTDAYTTVNTTGYITNGGDLGMKVGDIVLNRKTDASPPTIYSHSVVSVSATAPGAVDLDEGVQLAGASNSD